MVKKSYELFGHFCCKMCDETSNTTLILPSDRQGWVRGRFLDRMGCLFAGFGVSPDFGHFWPVFSLMTSTPFLGHFGGLVYKKVPKSWFWVFSAIYRGWGGGSHKAKNRPKVQKIRRDPKMSLQIPHSVQEPRTNPPRAVRRQNETRITGNVTHFATKSS